MNADHEEVISATGSRVQVLVVFTNEVRLMQTPRCPGAAARGELKLEKGRRARRPSCRRQAQNGITSQGSRPGRTSARWYGDAAFMPMVAVKGWVCTIMPSRTT
jgi:hypothetical protein